MTPKSTDNADYDGKVDEIPYEEAQRKLDRELNALQNTAEKQLRTNYQAKGDGWQYEVARYHLWKGIDEWFSATHQVKEENLRAFRRRLADGLNHALMAMYVAYEAKGAKPEDKADDGGA